MMNKITSLARLASFPNLGASVLLASLAFTPAVACTSGTIDDPEGDPTEEDVSSDAMTWEEFLTVIYQEPDTGIYIVNGDTPIESYRELRQFYFDYVQQQGRLIIATSGGADIKWSAAQKLNITYCISPSSFGNNYNAVVDAMNMAADAWEAAANVNFVHFSSEDSNCTINNNNVVFNVRFVTNVDYLARAFLPNFGRLSREIRISPAAFDLKGHLTLAGVLRHELGHSLGFLHEHMRPEAGEQQCVNVSGWRALTTYDAASVMYMRCDGSKFGDYILTQKDKDGVASVYGAP